MSKAAISPAKLLRHEVESQPLVGDPVCDAVEERIEYLLGLESERTQQHGSRQLAPPVDAHEHHVFRIELEVEPGAPVGDHAGREQQLAGGVGLAAIVLEEHAGRAM